MVTLICKRLYALLMTVFCFLVLIRAADTLPGVDIVGMVGGIFLGLYLLATLKLERHGAETTAAAPREQRSPVSLPTPRTPEMEKASQERLREVLRESPAVIDHSFTCLAKLSQKMDWAEVLGLVAVVRQGTAAALRDELAVVDDQRVKELAQEIAEGHGLDPELALWAVVTWRAVLGR